MNTSTKLVGTGVTLVVGSLLSVASVALGAGPQPTRVCLDDTSIGHCGVLTSTTTLPGGSGERVSVYVPEILRGDVKDHPNYGQITVDVVARGDAKDHPNYGQITADDGRDGSSRTLGRNLPV